MQLTTTRFEDYLQNTLDADQIRDIANHGMSGGVSGFIYYGELKALWNEYSNDIEDYLFNLDYSLKDLVDDCDGIDQLITKMIWVVVESYAQLIVEGEIPFKGDYALASA